MIFKLFGLHTRKASRDGCRDRCCCILTFFYIRLTNPLLNLARHTFLLITTNGQASADTDKIRYSTRPNVISASLSAQICLSCLHIQQRIGTPGKNGTSGHPVPNPKIQVQIASLSFGSLSVHCSCHTETRFKRPISNDRNAHFERQYS